MVFHMRWRLRGGRGGARDFETIQVRLFLDSAVASILGVIFGLWFFICAGDCMGGAQRRAGL